MQTLNLVHRLEYAAFTNWNSFLVTPSQDESKIKDTQPSVLRQEIAYKTLITSPTVQAPQCRSISTRHGQIDLMILHSFLCLNNCKQQEHIRTGD